MNIAVLLDKSKLADAVTQNFGVTYGYYMGRIFNYFAERKIIRDYYNEIRAAIDELPLFKEKYLNIQEVLALVQKQTDSYYGKCRNKGEEKAVLRCHYNINDIIQSNLEKCL